MMKEQGVEFPYAEPASVHNIKAGEGVCPHTMPLLALSAAQFMDVSPLHPRESPLEQDKKKADVWL